MINVSIGWLKFDWMAKVQLCPGIPRPTLIPTCLTVFDHPKHMVMLQLYPSHIWMGYAAKSALKYD